MWLFRKKTVKDYLDQILRTAQKAKAECEKGKVKNAIQLLKLIRQLDTKRFGLLKDATGSQKLVKESKEVYRLVDETLQKEPDVNVISEVLDRIIYLENYFMDIMKEIPFIPSEKLMRILELSPREAIHRGYLYRGLSDDEYKRIMRGGDLFAKDPNGNVTLIKHVFDPSNNPDTQFISLTADVNTARRFAEHNHIIVVDASKLKGALLSPKEIEQMTGRDTRVRRLVEKNFEFILAPTRKEKARIDVEALVR